MNKIEKANELGVYLRNYDIGEQRIRCPSCSPNRKKNNDNCLSVTITYDAILWMCHHCEWSGGSNDLNNKNTYIHQRHNEIITPVIPIVSSDNHTLSEI